MQRALILFNHLLEDVTEVGTDDLGKIAGVLSGEDALSDPQRNVCARLAKELKTESKTSKSDAVAYLESLRSDHPFVKMIEAFENQQQMADKARCEKIFKDHEGDDDDEDADVPEENDNNGGESIKAVLRGKIKVTEDESAILILGKWAFTVEDFQDASKNSKFKLKTVAEHEPQVRRGAEGSLIPFQGSKGTLTLAGFFVMKGEDEEDADRKVKERDIVMNFTAKTEGLLYAVEGKGSNEFGTFKLEGVYNAKKKKIVLNKTYDTDDDDDDDSEADYVGGEDVQDVDIVDDADVDTKAEAEALKDDPDQHLSVEELRRKYGGGPAETAPAPPAAVPASSNGAEAPQEKTKKKKKKIIIVKKIVKKVIRRKKKKRAEDDEVPAPSTAPSAPAGAGGVPQPDAKKMRVE